jgi:transposase
MDNCAIHDKEETFKMSKEWNVNVMFLPAYSPQLNPIEMWFHEIKTKIRKVNYAGERQLMEIMARTLKEYE